jgi:dTDP-4-amino-4,6-dideoxygalactose transaminase
MHNNKFIPLASPDITDNDITEVVRVLKSGMLVQGPEVELLEIKIASFIGVNHCIAASNGTATLHMSLIAMGIGPGDEVIVPAFSYIATANVVELTGAISRFVDIDIQTFNINADAIEKAISPKTKAIIVVHEFGLSADISKIISIANKHRIPVIEDAACALGATENEKNVGSFGRVGSFSLHPRKAISSGEGGLITTDDTDLSDKLRILRNHGIKLHDGKMDFVAAGFNYRMTDFQAVLVSSQLKRLPEILKVKSELAKVYFEELDSSRLQLPSVPAGRRHTWQTFHVLLPDDLDQMQVISQLRSRGVGTNYGAQCIPYQTYYAEKYKLDSAAMFPNALKSFKKGLALPIYEKLSVKDIKYISQQLNDITSKRV